MYLCIYIYTYKYIYIVRDSDRDDISIDSFVATPESGSSSSIEVRMVRSSDLAVLLKKDMVSVGVHHMKDMVKSILHIYLNDFL